MSIKSISFRSGEVIINNLPGVIFPLNTFVLLQKITHIKYGSKANDFFYFAGKMQGKTLMQQHIRELKHEDINTFKNHLLKLETFGIGKLNILLFDFKNKHIILKNLNSPIAAQYKKLFGLASGPIDYFLEGMCAGSAEILFDCSMQASETMCIGQGKKNCIIEIKEEGNLEKEDIGCKSINWKKFFEREIDDVPAKKTTAVVQKIFGLDQLSIKDGVFSIWNVPGIIFPMDSIVLLRNLFLDYFGKDINHIFYILGKTQVMGAIEIQRKLFGLKKSQDIITNIVQQAELIGMGNLTITKFDAKKKTLVIKNTNSQFCERYSKLFENQKNSANYFLAGCVAGLGQSLFGGNMVGIETKCTAKKNPFCCIVVKDKKEWNLEDSSIKEQFPRTIVDQNMLKKHTKVMSYLVPG